MAIVARHAYQVNRSSAYGLIDGGLGIVIYSFVIMLALATYFLHEKRIYKGPVVKIDRELSYGELVDYH